MKIIKHHTDDAPKALAAYTQGVEYNGVLYISGQIPFDAKTMKCVEGGIKAQVRQSLSNLDAIAKQAGVDIKKNAIKVSVFLKNINDYAAMNEVYREFFTDHVPARAALEVSSLPAGVDVEIEAIVAMKNDCESSCGC